MNDNIKWLFFDIGSTLIDESLVYENRMRHIAQTANATYEYVYSTAMNFYKQNKKGDLEMFKLLNVETLKWNHKDERLYADAEKCLRILSKKYSLFRIMLLVSGICIIATVR